MARIRSLAEFLLGSVMLKEAAERSRIIRLVEYKEPRSPQKFYAVQVSFDDTDILLEHHSIKQFKRTRNVYLFHPEQSHIPVKAHYHVYPPNSNRELYAVNIDGTAHHRTHRSHLVPAKEADELRAMGVDLAMNNLLESIESLSTEEFLVINESLEGQEGRCIFLIFEED